MTTNKKEMIANVATMALNPVGYLLGQITETTSKSISEADENAKVALTELRVNAERQELEMRIAEAHARVAQEIAIAKRIESAERVEMEEFYDYSGDAQAGAKIDDNSISLGASGSIRRISSRKFVFLNQGSV